MNNGDTDMQKRLTSVKTVGVLIALFVNTSALATDGRSIEDKNFHGFPVAEIVAPFITKISAGCSPSAGSIGGSEDALSGLLLTHPNDLPKSAKSKEQADSE
ncbi:hypothetical protein MELB17_09073 [Marinobacter sp. ELB17]|nr:hypothetical protein MELB17_09073 [Marinobacter sp. ELB17]